MNANEIREVARSQPFRPFTIYMDDGASYRVEHPDGVALGNFVAVVALPPTDEGDKFMRLSIRHISRIEETVSVNGGRG
ncbi:MAG TPA: hypothetical protein VGM76_06860 [Lacipirellulaceae bacterium]|jgi:hypothetical protein